MALERTQTGLEFEVREAVRKIEPHRQHLENEHLRTCGKAYGDNADNAEVDEDPENFRQAWLRSFLADVGQGTPQFIIEAQGIEWPPTRAYLIQQAINTVALEQRLGAPLGFVHRTAVDYGFRSARAVCSLKTLPNSKRVIPTVEDLAFDELIYDSTVSGMHKARWIGHRVACDIDDKIAEAKAQPKLGWNVEMLERMRDNMTKDRRRNDQSAVQRNELVYWCLWEPGYQLDPKRGEDQGFNGTMHYVVDPQCSISSKLGQTKKTVRASAPWFGAASGPYAFAAGMKIGELPIPLAPLVGGAVQGAAMNEVARGILAAIRSYKRNSVVSNDDVANLLRVALNGQLIAAPAGVDLRSMLATAESGGLTQEMVAGFQLVMESAQRALGTYSSLGDVDADATATAINAASAGYASTMQLHTTNFRGFLGDIGEKWAFWADCSEDVSVRVGPLPPEVAQEFGGKQFVDVAGSIGGQHSPTDHRKIALSVDAFSVRAKNEMTMAQDVAAVTGAIGFLASLGPLVAGVDVDEYMRAVSRSRGIKWSEKLVDAKVLYTIAAMQIGSGEVSTPKPTTQPNQQISFAGLSGASKAPAMAPSTGLRKQTPMKPAAPAKAGY